jgi:hypothetical protein
LGKRKQKKRASTADLRLKYLFELQWAMINSPQEATNKTKEVEKAAVFLLTASSAPPLQCSTKN